MPQTSEIVETDIDRAVALIEGRVQIHAQARHGRSFDRRLRRGIGQHHQPLIRFCQIAGQELAFGPMQFQMRTELMPALPRSQSGQ